MKDSNKDLLRKLTSNDPLESAEFQTQDLQLASNFIHPVAYISSSFSQSQCRWPAITKECFSVFMSIKKCSPYLQNTNLLIYSDHKPLLKIFTRHTNNEKCNTWGLEASAIPIHVKIQHIKGIANVLADSVLRLRAVGLYHDLDSMDCQQEFSSPFEPLPPVKKVTHMPIEVTEISIAPDIEKLLQNYDALHDLPTAQMDKAELSLENASSADIPHLEQNLMSLLEFTPDKVIKLQKNDTF